MILQCATTLGLSGLFLLWGHEAAASALLGGGIGVAGSAYFARSVFRPIAARPAKQVLVSIYASEIGKLVLVFVLFFIVFKCVPMVHDTLNALVMFVSFAAIQGVHILAPLLIKPGE